VGSVTFVDRGSPYPCDRHCDGYRCHGPYVSKAEKSEEGVKVPHNTQNAEEETPSPRFFK